MAKTIYTNRSDVLSTYHTLMPKKKPMNPHHIEHILDEMFELYKDFPLTELVYETPFQCLIAVLLSAQTTDKQVNKVTKHLFQVVREPQDVLDI